jgi:hypothetical protein
MSSTWTATSAEYNFASDGGSVGTKTLRRQMGIPANAVLASVILEPLIEPTSAGAATIAIGINAAGDLLAATAFDDGTYDPARGAAIVNTFPGKTTAARGLIVTIAGAALTAGKFRVHVEYVKGTAT